MLAIASRYLRDRETVEEVVQDAWEAILRGIERFEGRSKLSTWIYAIVANKARKRAKREGRSSPISGLSETEGPDTLMDRFQANGKWLAPPAPWGRRADEVVGARSAVASLMIHLDTLPDAQRAAVILRDIEGHDSSTICEILGVSGANLRVLLHRGRCRLRDHLEEWRP